MRELDVAREKVRAILLARWVLDPTQDLEETLDEIDAAYRDAQRKIERIRALVATWAVDDDTYLHLDGQDLGYADAAVQITAIIGTDG